MNYGAWFDRVLAWWARRYDPDLLFIKYEDLSKVWLAGKNKTYKYVNNNNNSNNNNNDNNNNSSNNNYNNNNGDPNVFCTIEDPPSEESHRSGTAVEIYITFTLLSTPIS